MKKTKTNAQKNAQKFDSEKVLADLESAFLKVQSTNLRFIREAKQKNELVDSLSAAWYFLNSPAKEDSPNLSGERLGYFLSKVNDDKANLAEIYIKTRKARKAPAGAPGSLDVLNVEQLKKLRDVLCASVRKENVPNLLDFVSSDFHQPLKAGRYKISDPRTKAYYVANVSQDANELFANSVRVKGSKVSGCEIFAFLDVEKVETPKK